VALTYMSLKLSLLRRVQSREVLKPCPVLVHLRSSTGFFLESRRILEMHKGTLYPTVFRRDFPTYREFPNLWPDRCLYSMSGITGLPGPRLTNMGGVMSSAGVVLDHEPVLRYVFENGVGINLGRVRWDTSPKGDGENFLVELIYSDDAYSGSLRLNFESYVVDFIDDHWLANASIPSSQITVNKSGDFASCAIPGSFSLQALFAGWTENPNGWWNGH